VTPRKFQIAEPPIEAPSLDPEHETRATPAWTRRWFEELADAVSADDPWGLLGQRPDGDYFLFSCRRDDVRACAEYSVRVWLLYPEGP
jgi:hypothetical protein